MTPDTAPGAIYLQASIAMWAGRWRDASLLLDVLLQLPAASTELRVGEACLRLIPDRQRVRTDLARCLIESDRTEDADRILAPEDARDEVRFLRARIALKQQRPDLALIRLGSHHESWADLDWDAAGCPDLAALLVSPLIN